MINAQQAADNWAASMQNVAAKVKAGVQSLQVSPTALAAAAVERQVAGVMRAAQSGKTASALNSVSLSSWQNAMINKGSPRIASGATAAKPKMVSFMNQFLPFMQNLVANLPARGDLQTNISRATAVMNGAAQFQYQKPNS
jgi:hypothetical protein